MVWPEAEFPVDEELVRHLLADQHPDLVARPLRAFDAGWDNVMWRLGDDLLVRLPRRLTAAPLIEHEHRWLPGLAGKLPLAVPVPLRKGRPSGYYPWHWSVVPWIEGTPGDRRPPVDMVESGRRLGSFLRAMHTPAPDAAPYNPFRGGPIRERVDAFEARLAKVSSHVDPVPLRRVWDAAVAAPDHLGPPVWLHGDLHPANLLVLHGAVVAVIDFGDMCGGDPACDLGAAWMSLAGAGMEPFWAAYGPPDPDMVRRSYGWCVLFALMLLDIGLESRPTYADVGRSALVRMADLAAGCGRI